jgi:hypothetical protein
MDTRLDPRVELSHRATGSSETARNDHLEVVIGALIHERCNAGESVARGQTYDDAVRVVNNGRIVDSKAERGGRRPAGFNCALDF